MNSKGILLKIFDRDGVSERNNSQEKKFTKICSNLDHKARNMAQGH